ncbi:MAG: hypothetical protein R3F59_19585 [Myxococcota bacterium]
MATPHAARPDRRARGRLRRHPGDQQAWLAYADVLRARGDERGEFVLRTHRVAGGGADPEDAAWWAALDQRYQGWMRELKATVPHAHQLRVLDWSYGFATRAAALTVEAFAALCDSPFGALLGTVGFPALDAAEAHDLAHAPALAQLCRLALRGLPDPDVQAVVARGGGLAELALHRCTLGPGAVSAVAALPLEALQILEATVGDDGALALAVADAPIRRLHLSRCWIGPRGAGGIGTMQALEWLDLGHNPLQDDGLAALLGLPNLRQLRIPAAHVTEAGLRALLSPDALPSLRRLQLDDDLSAPLRDALDARGVSVYFGP